MAVRKRNFVIRKIRSGRAKILGVWYYPDDRFMEYDGRLDGMQYAFGLYWNGDERDESLVCLWGTKEQYNFEADDWGPELVDGAFPWLFWHPKKEAINAS